MTERMAAAGYPVDVDTVFALLPEGASAGRPHLARALVGAGVVASVDEAFAKLLYTGSPYYVEKVDTPAATAVAMVRAAGGVAVFAHPLARRRGRVVDERAIAELATAGLAGLEVDHPDHAPADRALLRGLAAELDLVVTGSSDYHGTNKTTPLAAETTDPAQFEALVARAAPAWRSSQADARPPDRRPPASSPRPRLPGCARVVQMASECAIGHSALPRIARSLARTCRSRVPGARDHGQWGGTTVDGWTAAHSSGWTRSTPRSRPARCCASPPPGSRPGATAPGATG